jgi:hypothetical protein
MDPDTQPDPSARSAGGPPDSTVVAASLTWAERLTGVFAAPEPQRHNRRIARRCRPAPPGRPRGSRRADRVGGQPPCVGPGQQSSTSTPCGCNSRVVRAARLASRRRTALLPAQLYRLDAAVERALTRPRCGRGTQAEVEAQAPPPHHRAGHATQARVRLLLAELSRCPRSGCPRCSSPARGKRKPRSSGCGPPSTACPRSSTPSKRRERGVR